MHEKSSSWHFYVKRKIYSSKKFFNSIVSNKFSNMFLLRFYLIGMDLLKHGESAYPADAWVEQQYMKEDAIDVSYFPRFFWYKVSLSIVLSIFLWLFEMDPQNDIRETSNKSIFDISTLFCWKRWDGFLFVIRFGSRNEKLSKSSNHIKHKWVGWNDFLCI